MKKIPGMRDHRSEPDSEGTTEKFRVDRVFTPPRPKRSSTTPPQRHPATKPPTIPPALGTPSSTSAALGDSETELSLRRQLSRLQRQLSDAQRELANKDDEVAAAVEKRLEIQAAYEVIREEQRNTQLVIDEAIADRARAAGVEQRLGEAIAGADELRHQLERERTERATVVVQLEELQAAFEKARTSWRDESATMDDQHVALVAQLEQQKKQAVEAIEAAMRTAIERQSAAHEAELEALKAAHERALAALRGELEPAALSARDLSVEIERLNSQLQAQATEHQNILAERVELHSWEKQQQAEAHAGELAGLSRQHSSEMTRLAEEVLAANQAGHLIERNAKLREELWEQTTQTLRESQKQLQQELAETRERAAQANATKVSVESRLFGTLQTLDKAQEQAREFGERLEVVEAELRRTALDRERFAAYLQEGLAMLGALPATDEEDDRAREAIHAADATATEQTSRSTRSYDLVDPADLDSGRAATQIPTGLEDEPEPLPDPTRP